MTSCKANILRKLRAALRNTKYVSQPLQAYIITNNDPHLSEYLADCDKRIEYVSGFSGSAGTALVTDDDALLWTDGRYHLQAAEEIDTNWTLMKTGYPETLSESDWINTNLEKGSRIGIDAKNIPYSTWLALKKDLEWNGHILVPVGTNLVDLIWDDRPDPPENIIEPQAFEYSGKLSKTKVIEVRKKMLERGADTLILTALDDIAWLLNLRGSDIPYNPVFFAYLVLMNHQVHLFVDEHKITLNVRNHFNAEDLPISLHAYDGFYNFISYQIASKSFSKKIWIGSHCNFEIYNLIPERQRLTECSPVALMKATKNNTEIKGMVSAHIKDAVALCRYFAWLERQVPLGTVTELSGSEQLECFRRDEEGYIGPSFATISSSGPNAAKNHYRPTPQSDRPITCKEIYLCDSGGQFRDGTTDVTRTLHFGKPSGFERICFTRVFQGQTALGTTIFPAKIKGNSLDVIARKALWDVGLDYLHSTGHGIGAYLHVHEGPMGIGNKPCPDDPGLEANMFLSNEPGYYEDGSFGIRLENIVQIIPAKTPYSFKQKEFLTFKTITLVPIQTKLLMPEKMSEREILYLNDYHYMCRTILGPIMIQSGYHEAYEWLVKETEPIA